MLLVPLIHSQAFAHHAEGESEEEVVTVHDREYTMASDAAEIAELVGVTVDEARAALELQPRVSELQMALLRGGPQSYGGMYIQYQPEYAIKTLAEPHRADEVLSAIDRLGFGDLRELVSMKETALTEQALGRAQAAISRGKARVLWSSVDLMGGKVEVAVANRADADHARDEMRRTDLGHVPPERVEVIVSEPLQEEDSYGGLPMDDPCTSGWTVVNTNTGVEGMANAGHCGDNEKLTHHSTVTLNLQAQKNADSQDVQWYTTPGLDDKKQFRAWDDHSVQAVNARKHRDGMVINQTVCHYGKTTGRACGTIIDKSLDPNDIGHTGTFNATFIRVEVSDADETALGDSGGPWFLYDTAYGIHKGSTPGNPDNGFDTDPYFMAQNYMSALNIQVRITGD